jgi:hypothetical protein
LFAVDPEAGPSPSSLRRVPPASLVGQIRPRPRLDDADDVSAHVGEQDRR